MWRLLALGLGCSLGQAGLYVGVSSAHSNHGFLVPTGPATPFQEDLRKSLLHTECLEQ